MVPSPPKIKITSASSEAAGIPMRQSMFASIWKGLRFFAEHPSPKMTAARMCADEGSRIHCGDTEAWRGISSAREYFKGGSVPASFDGPRERRLSGVELQ